MDTVTLSMRDVLEVMRVNPVAHDEFKLAKAKYGRCRSTWICGIVDIGAPGERRRRRSS